MSASASGSCVDAFVVEDDGEVPAELLDGQERELEVLGARADGRQHLLRVGGGEHEHDVRGRLLERLQQRVRRRRVSMCTSSTMYTLRFAVAPRPRLTLWHEVAHVVDAVVRRGVELDEVEERARRDRHAVLALAARLAVGAEIEAVQRLGEDAGGGGLAGAARAGEQVRVADAVLADRVAQRGGDVVLADELAEPLRAVLAVQRLERHRLATLPAASGDPPAVEPTRRGPCTRRRPDAVGRGSRRWLRPGDPAAHGRAR